jgi:ATP-dependent RNA helicase DDX23/PRP28
MCCALQLTHGWLLYLQEIEKYCHRIGRTGRAGKEGHATSFFTDDDKEIMWDLKQYLISTDHAVPAELARHPAAQANPKEALPGAKRKDTVLFVK